jgi:hypothetical protein
LIIDAQQSIPGVANLQEAAAELKVIVINTRATIQEIEDLMTEDTKVLSPVQLVGALEDIYNTLSDPAMDAFATALAREMEPGFARNLAVSKGILDPREFATMRERVRGEILKNRSEWLRQRARGECGRPAGAAFRSVVADSDAAQSYTGTESFSILAEGDGSAP